MPSGPWKISYFWSVKQARAEEWCSLTTDLEKINLLKDLLFNLNSVPLDRLWIILKEKITKSPKTSDATLRDVKCVEDEC